jgi:hypothetical protein
MALELVGILFVLAVFWILRRPNRSRVDPRLGLETWPVVSDGLHNSNTDLLFWRDAFWLAHAASPWHLGSRDCRLVIRRSADARTWSRVAELRMPGEDIRDPKFAVVGEQLFLYALANRGLYARPYVSVVARTADGERWSPFEPVTLIGVEAEGWLLWRPKTRDGRAWFAAAYWHEHGRSILLRSEDGWRWSLVSRIWNGDANDETDIEWLPDGRLLATARLEMTPDALLGNARAHTLLAVAEPPYTRWSYTHSCVARLDGPALFAHAGRVFAVARFQPPPFGPLTQQASTLARKRTSLYLVEPTRLTWLSDVPSAGDTSYAGVVLREGQLFFSYYTSDVRRDWPWLLGMFRRSEIRMARVPLAQLDALACERAENTHVAS